MIKFLTFAATALTGLALSSGAIAGMPKDVPAPEATAPATDTAAQPAAKEQKYCVRDTTTGSRIPLKVCKTRKEWKAEGFDPLADK